LKTNPSGSTLLIILNNSQVNLAAALLELIIIFDFNDIYSVYFFARPSKIGLINVL